MQWHRLEIIFRQPTIAPQWHVVRCYCLRCYISQPKHKKKQSWPSCLSDVAAAACNEKGFDLRLSVIFHVRGDGWN